MQLGLHRPENIQDFSRVERLLNLEGIQDSVRIWAGCYIAAQWYVPISRTLHNVAKTDVLPSVASSIGQESILKPDQMITRAAEPNNVYQLPIGLHHYLRLTKFSVHVSKVLSEDISTPLGLPDERNRAQIMDRLEMEFDQLKTDLMRNSTSESQIIAVSP
jgi:transcriptional regulatory protein LEU3